MGKIGYSYGVEIFEKNGISQICHNGIIAGYTSTLVYYPQSKFHLIILENKNYSPRTWGIEEQKSAFYIHDKVREFIELKTLKFLSQ
jgi:hypothetical protein